MGYEFKPYSFTAKRYEAKLPALTNGVETNRHAVAIVGGGRVGLTLALGLATYGIASVLIEADDSVCFGSRAICISRRSLEIIERLGALPEFLEKGLPWTGGRSFYRDTEVLHFEMPHDENQKLPPMVNIQQYYIEQFLLNAAEKRADLIDIRWQTRATAIQMQENGVTLSLSTPTGEYTLHADWLVACDGGRSQVREALGLQLHGTSYEGRYVIADLELKSDRPTERLAWFNPPSNPGSTILMHKQPDDIWRIDYQLRDDEDSEEAVKPENVIPRVKSHLEMMGETRDWSPIWITLYRAHALSLESYRHGRAGPIRRRCRASRADLRRARGEFLHRRRRQSGLEARLRRQGAGVRSTARHVLAGTGARHAREPELRHQEHGVHGAAIVRLRADAASGAEPRGEAPGAPLLD